MSLPADNNEHLHPQRARSIQSSRSLTLTTPNEKGFYCHHCEFATHSSHAEADLASTIHRIPVKHAQAIQEIAKQWDYIADPSHTGIGSSIVTDRFPEGVL